MSSKTLPFVLALLLSSIAIGAALLSVPAPADQALLAARWTARAAIPIFLIVYLARPLNTLLPSGFTRRLLRFRRQWGLSFALSMTIHLAALLVNILVFRPRGLGEIAAGMAAYAMVYIMAFTSNDWSQKRLGRWWHHLHRAGLHYIWGIFFGGRVLRLLGGEPEYYPAAAATAAALLIALLVRAAAWLMQKRRGPRITATGRARFADERS